MSINTKKMTRIALFSAILCVISPFSIPVGTVPISLATLGVYFAAAVLEPISATLSVLIYVLLGAVGVPVFSGMRGGVSVIAGPTGGFIVGYIACAFLASLLIHKFGKKLLTPVWLVIATAVLYVIGTVWFMVVMKQSLAAAIGACVLPFLLGDALKIIIVSVFDVKLSKYIK